MLKLTDYSNETAKKTKSLLETDSDDLNETSNNIFSILRIFLNLFFIIFTLLLFLF